MVNEGAKDSDGLNIGSCCFPYSGSVKTHFGKCRLLSSRRFIVAAHGGGCRSKKKRFDDIYDSARYAQASETVNIYVAITRK